MTAISRDSHFATSVVSVDLPEPSGPTKATASPPWGGVRVDLVGARTNQFFTRHQIHVHSRVHMRRVAPQAVYIRYDDNRGSATRRNARSWPIVGPRPCGSAT